MLFSIYENIKALLNRILIIKKDRKNNISAYIKLQKEIEEYFWIKNGNQYQLRKDSINNLLNDFLKYTNEINKIFKNNIPCKIGCSKCCFIHIAISELEVGLIKEYIDR